MEEIITTSFYKTEDFKNIINGILEKKTKTSSIEKYRNILEKPKNICEIDTIIKSENPMESFIFEETKSFLSARKIGDITSFCISNNNLELFTYLIKEYPSELVLNYDFDSGLFCAIRLVLFDRKIMILDLVNKSLEFLKVIFEVYPNFYNMGFEEFFNRSFFERNRCDITDFVLSKLPEKQVLDIFSKKYCYPVFNTKTLDCFQLLINKFPEILSKFEHRSIKCNCFEILKIFRLHGCLSKINVEFFKKHTLMTPDIEEFFEACKFEFD